MLLSAAAANGNSYMAASWPLEFMGTRKLAQDKLNFQPLDEISFFICMESVEKAAR